MKKILMVVLAALVMALVSGCASYSTKFVNTTQVDENKLVKNSSNDVSIVAFPLEK